MHIGINDGGIAFNDGAVGDCDCCGGDPCPDGICAYPTVDVTLSWTDADTTKTFASKAFTNGQTIEICPSNYLCVSDSGTTTSSYHPTPFTWTDKYETWKLKNTFAWTIRGYHARSTIFNNTTTWTYVSSTVQVLHKGKRGLDLTFRKAHNANSFGRDKWSNKRDMFFGAIDSADVTAPHGGSVFRNWSFKGGATYNTPVTVWYWNQPNINPYALTTFVQPTSLDGITSASDGSYTTSRGITVTWAIKTSSPCSSLKWGQCFVP